MVRAEFEEAWMEKGEAQTAVRSTLVGGSTFHVAEGMQKLQGEIIEIAEVRYLEVYAGEVKEFAKAGGEGGKRVEHQGRRRKGLRKLERIRER